MWTAKLFFSTHARILAQCRCLVYYFVCALIQATQAVNTTPTPSACTEYGTRCWALSYYVHIPFFQVAMQNPNMVLVRPCFRAQKWEPGPCLHTVFVSFESTTFESLISAYFKMAYTRAKWSNYVHCHIEYSRCEHNTIFCWLRHWFPGTKCGRHLRQLSCSPAQRHLTSFAGLYLNKRSFEEHNYMLINYVLLLDLILFKCNELFTWSKLEQTNKRNWTMRRQP